MSKNSKHTRIEIDIEVYKIIVNNQKSFDETPNDILRRLLGLDFTIEESERSDRVHRKLIPRGHLHQMEGLELRKRYAGKDYVAWVRKTGIELNGEIYPTLSAAARTVTRNNVNGWNFWKCIDESTGKWIKVNQIFR